MTVRLELGDCLDVLPRLRAEGVLVDAVVTDPPYHLVSMTKRVGAPDAKPIQHGTDGAFARAAGGFMGQAWDGGDVAFRPDTWQKVMTVMKPGAWLVAFGGTRTCDLLTGALRAAGFEIRDRLWNAIASDSHVLRFLESLSAEQRDAFALAIEDSQFGGELAWMFGSGFPKGGDVAGHEGLGTAIKPAFEPIVLARKPLSEGSVAANIARWGTGALNIAAARIDTAGEDRSARYAGKVPGAGGSLVHQGAMTKPWNAPDGRFPANVVHDGSARCWQNSLARQGRWRPFTAAMAISSAAARAEGMEALLIEREPAYAADICVRLGLPMPDLDLPPAEAPPRHDHGPLFHSPESGTFGRAEEGTTGA